MEEKIEIEDNVGATVIKGGAKMTPKQFQEALDNQKKADPNEKTNVEVVLPMYKELVDYLNIRAKVMKLDLAEVLSSLILDATRMYHNHGCPFCLPEKLQKKKEARARLTAIAKREADRKKAKRKSQKASRKANRG